MGLQGHDNQISFGNHDHHQFHQHQQLLFHSNSDQRNNADQISFGMLHQSSSVMPEHFM